MTKCFVYNLWNTRLVRNGWFDMLIYFDVEVRPPNFSEHKSKLIQYRIQHTIKYANRQIHSFTLLLLLPNRNLWPIQNHHLIIFAFDFRIWIQNSNNGKRIAGQSIHFPRRITGYGHSNISRMHELHSMEWSTESIADIDRFRHDCHGNYSDIRLCIWSSFESGRNHRCCRLRSAKYSGNWRIGDLQSMPLRCAIIVFCHFIYRWLAFTLLRKCLVRSWDTVFFWS